MKTCLLNIITYTTKLGEVIVKLARFLKKPKFNKANTYQA